MNWLLSMIPFVGKAIDAWSAHDQKKLDVGLEKYKVDGTFDVEAMRQDTEVIKARAQLAAAMKDDPVNKWGRRLFIYPVGVWFVAIVTDSLLHRAFSYTYRVEALPQNLDYIPYAIIAYLFVTAWKK